MACVRLSSFQGELLNQLAVLPALCFQTALLQRQGSDDDGLHDDQQVGYVGEKEIVNRNVNKKESKLSWKSEESTKGVDEIEKSDELLGAKSSEIVSSTAITK